MHHLTDSTETTIQWVQQIVDFDGPPEQFLMRLLSAQCTAAGAVQGAILRQNGRGAEVIAIHPPPKPPVQNQVWLAQTCELAPRVIADGRSQVVPLRQPDEMYGASPSRYLLLLPLIGGAGVRGAAAFFIHTSDPAAVQQAVQRVEPTAGFLSLYEMRLTLRQRSADMRRLRQACQILSEVNSQKRYKGAAMALCNQIATVFDAERVSLGWIKGRYVKLGAMSHTEKFTRKMELVTTIESAMEECADQDVEIVHPAAADSTTVHRAAGELATQYGPTTVLSLPLRQEARVSGVLTIERAPDQTFKLEEAEALRLTCDLCIARLADLEASDKWIGVRATSAVRSGLATVLGPSHTWVKLAAVLVLGVMIFATLTHGTYRVEAPFVVEASQRQLISAPFSGYFLDAPVRPGDHVVAGQTVLARLDTAQLLLQRAEAEAERRGHIKEAQIARREAKISQEQIALADAERVAARIDLLDWQIQRATIVSPIDGVVVAGDLTQSIGGPVEVGQQLFEVAPLNQLRARLAIPEDQVIDLRTGQSGRLAAVSHPGDYLRFEIERIDPTAQIADQRNVFYAQARLLDTPRWLRPGMEGLSKVDVGPARYAWLWTRDLMNWVRMKLWL